MYTMPFAMVVTIGLLYGTPAIAQPCGGHKIALQILGSGGPFPSSSASTGYIVWLDGRSVVLVDAGGGVFLRFGQAGARMDQLELIAISHLHPDHVADLPALLWLTGFRSTPLRVVGPSGDDHFPAFGAFLGRLLGDSESAFPILARRDNVGQGGAASLTSITIDVVKTKPTAIPMDGELRLTALGVPHAAPAVAYRVSIGGTSIVFGSDQNGSNPTFVDFARAADILVMHFAISMDAIGRIRENHAPPDIVGHIAARANPGRLILSHLGYPRIDDPNSTAFSAHSATSLTDNVEEVKKWYRGPVIVAEDLQCVVLRE